MATGEPRSYQFLCQRLSVAIQRGNAACVVGTVPGSRGLEDIFYIQLLILLCLCKLIYLTLSLPAYHCRQWIRLTHIGVSGSERVNIYIIEHHLRERPSVPIFGFLRSSYMRSWAERRQKLYDVCKNMQL